MEEPLVSNGGLTEETMALIGLLQQKTIRPFKIPEKTTVEGVDDFVNDVYFSFYRNIESCISLATVVFDICSQFEQESVFRRHLASERILQMADAAEARKGNLSLDASMESQALQNAYTRLEGHIKDGNAMLSSVAGRVLHLIDQLNYGRQADNLTRQAIVLMWTSFESFCREILREMLNEKPKLYRRLMRDSEFRKEIRSIDIEVLELKNFDISKSLGDVVILSRDMSNARAIERLFVLLYPDSEKLGEILKAKSLHKLAKTRNLIVHNGGVVDEKFLSTTDDKSTIGQLIRFDTIKFEGYAVCVLAAATQILLDVSTDFMKP